MDNRNITLQVDGLDIEGRLYIPDGIDRFTYPVLCICHGIPSGMPSDPGDTGYPGLAERICSQGFGVFIFNFRGTGTSEGNLDMVGWSRDLKAAIDYLYELPWLDKSRFSLLGFSAGATISVYVAAADNRISAVVACACPAEFSFGDSFPLVEHFRGIGAIRDGDFPPSVEEWIEGFNTVGSLKYIDRITPRPLLLVHGSQDEVVKISQVYDLYVKAGEPKHIIIIDGAGHRLKGNDRAMSIVVDWLESQG